MRPLIDGDILRYEIGFCGEQKNKETGEMEYLSFDRVAKLLDDRIDDIVEGCGGTESPIIYLTADKKMCERDGIAYNPNFREEIAVTKKYKDTRKKAKPFHFDNLTVYMQAEYECNVSVGIEADDAMAMEQVEKTFIVDGQEYDRTIICSRDKDLRMVPGWHYSWECGAQGELGPIFVDDNKDGWLEYYGPKKDKVRGYGKKFFYYQMLVGDVVDNIPGCPGWGAKKSMALLGDVKGERNMYEAVRSCYQDKYTEDAWLDALREQAYLLWMVQECDEDGEPIMWEPPSKEEE